MNFKYTLNVLAAAHSSASNNFQKASSKDQGYNALTLLGKFLFNFLRLSH